MGIPPMQDIYDLIIFNGHDIQDVQVVEKKEEQDEQPAIDPAIMRAEIRKNSGDNQNKKQHNSHKHNNLPPRSQKMQEHKIKNNTFRKDQPQQRSCMSLKKIIRTLFLVIFCIFLNLFYLTNAETRKKRSKSSNSPINKKLK